LPSKRKLSAVTWTLCVVPLDARSRTLLVVSDAALRRAFPRLAVCFLAGYFAALRFVVARFFAGAFGFLVFFAAMAASFPAEPIPARLAHNRALSWGGGGSGT